MNAIVLGQVEKQDTSGNERKSETTDHLMVVSTCLLRPVQNMTIAHRFVQYRHLSS